MFAHLMAPHPPFLYGADGSETGPPAMLAGMWDYFAAQIEELGITRARVG